MKRHILQDDELDVRKMYIVQRPTKLSDLDLDGLETEVQVPAWRKKSREMQARAWRRLKNQQA